MTFSEDQMLRYARHIVLPEIGGQGQARLLASSVLLIGAGGLGSPLLLYLAAAGVGRIGIAEPDQVELANLHRQIAHPNARIGMAKGESARASALALNPEVEIDLHPVRVDPSNAAGLLAGYDLVADGSDSFETRDCVHAACHALGRTLVSAAVQGLEGQLTTFKAHLGPPHPCLRCLFPEAPPTDLIPSCAAGGVLGPAAGVVGCLQAVEVVKELLELGTTLSGRLLLYDALGTSLQAIQVQRRRDCPRCGGHQRAA